MENQNKIYWKGVEELSNELEFVKNAGREFSTIPSDNISNNSSRRDFLKLLGFSVAAVSLAACEAPVKKAIPYLNKPEDIDPTIANFYASTYYDSNGGYASILVKTREGRPIKIEPNDFAKDLSGTSARVQASLLTLYDSTRLKGPRQQNKNIDWKEADAKITAELASAGQIRIVSSTIFSPTTKKVIADFIKKYPDTQHIQYDALSASGILKANQESFGTAMIPSYDFGKAEVIVSIGADFLGTWLSSTEYSAQYTRNRKLGKAKKTMSRHYQFETGLSLTGANADYRGIIKPSQEGLVVKALYDILNGGTAELKGVKNLEKAAKDLQNAKGKSLVVSGSNDPAVQTLVNAINNLLSNYGTTIDLNTPLYLKQGDDEKMANFVQEAKDGKIGAVLFYNANPVYDYPAGKDLVTALKNIKTKISFADRVEETASLCNYITPDHHYLESWNDAEPKKGFYSLCQPTISPIFKTRQAQESLLVWSGNTISFQEYLENAWKEDFYNKELGFASANEFWTYTLHDGLMVSEQKAEEPTKEDEKENTDKEEKPKKAIRRGEYAFKGDANAALSAITQRYKTGNGLELALYEKVSMGNGDQANNPWLQEMPDPISKACWDNYAAISQKTANDLKLVQGDVIKVEAGGKSVELPVLIQPGQADNTLSIAVG
ncbi:MAG: TAT-variant-translocated molybdopterin oxidoreductase, partial [Verrucomicrobia bacterium]|nr:TAT-variant-translocated molybdopterin oxidoreductase [Cytophagales bacterium]